MTSKIAADCLVVVHLLWICFMLLGCLVGVVGLWKRQWLDWMWFRTLHLIGIAFVAVLIAINQPCPLTTWESSLRQQHDPLTAYPGSFIVHYLERVVYPDVDPVIISIPTIILALMTVGLYFWRPPERLRRLLGR